MSDPAALRENFLAQLAASLRDATFVKLTLGKPRGPDATLRNLFIRPVTLRGTPHLTFLWRHATQDITKNSSPADALAQIAALLGSTFHSAHLFTTARMAQLEFNKHGEPRLTYGPAAPAAAAATHDQPKHRLLPPESQRWLEKLGVTTATGAVRTGMADKHRQIHQFTEILSHLVAAAFPGESAPAQGRANRPGEPRLDALLACRVPTPARPLEIADMGCGKGYLTFATHDYFNHVAGRAARVHGVEARPALVETSNRTARDCGCANLDFTAGTITSAPFAALDVLLALHACDTATDDAIAKGLAAGAALIVVAPCCQKELRPQLTAAPVLAPALRHGIFQERHAEFVTDALRALLLEWAGYDTKVFEFISTEHTAKNLMIAATRRAAPDEPARRENHARAVRDLAAFYGLRQHALARHLAFNFAAPPQAGL
ncbi:MAG: SAM-dependent methyltransferase [Opitutae bacterium]|nr:SAM-dependent methyltransferase [Opitutae bacterium]